MKLNMVTQAQTDVNKRGLAMTINLNQQTCKKDRETKENKRQNDEKQKNEETHVASQNPAHISKTAFKNRKQ